MHVNCCYRRNARARENLRFLISHRRKNPAPEELPFQFCSMYITLGLRGRPDGGCLPSADVGERERSEPAGCLRHIARLCQRTIDLRTRKGWFDAGSRSGKEICLYDEPTIVVADSWEVGPGQVRGVNGDFAQIPDTERDRSSQRRRSGTPGGRRFGIVSCCHHPPVRTRVVKDPRVEGPAGACAFRPRKHSTTRCSAPRRPCSRTRTAPLCTTTRWFGPAAPPTSRRDRACVVASGEGSFQGWRGRMVADNDQILDGGLVPQRSASGFRREGISGRGRVGVCIPGDRCLQADLRHPVTNRRPVPAPASRMAAA